MLIIVTADVPHGDYCNSCSYLYRREITSVCGLFLNCRLRVEDGHIHKCRECLSAEEQSQTFAEILDERRGNETTDPNAEA